MIILSEIHDCDKCHGKMVSVTVDKLGITRCGYCHEIVDYSEWYSSVNNRKVK